MIMIGSEQHVDEFWTHELCTEMLVLQALQVPQGYWVSGGAVGAAGWVGLRETLAG